MTSGPRDGDSPAAGVNRTGAAHVLRVAETFD